MRHRPCALGLTGLLFLASTGVAQQPQEKPDRPAIYKWVDENGIAHYTADPERIPEDLRQRLGVPTPVGRQPEVPGETGAALEPARDLGGSWAVQDADPEDPFGEFAPGSPGSEGSSAREPRRLEPDLRVLEQRITSLEAEILRDEERLKTWVADPEVDPVLLADDPEFREIAARLPRLQNDLRDLKQQQAQSGQEP
jgi:hypothetical protein